MIIITFLPVNPIRHATIKWKFCMLTAIYVRIPSMGKWTLKPWILNVEFEWQLCSMSRWCYKLYVIKDKVGFMLCASHVYSQIEISREPVTARYNDVVGKEVIIHFFNTVFCWNDIFTSVITICTGNISR